MRKLKIAVAEVARMLIDLLPAIWRMELFRICGRSIGVKYAAFGGGEGVFESPIYDRFGWPLYVEHGTLDEGTGALLAGLFGSGSGTLIDVGANVGMICIPAKRHAPGIDVYAIEPDLDNCECLRMNAYRAGFPEIRIFNRAAYKIECTLDFERSEDNAGDHRIRNPQSSSAARCDLYGESTRPVRQVQASRLDAMIPAAGLKRPVVVKCDVQGAEAGVVEGATGLLNAIDVLIMEFWPYGLKRAGTDLEKLLSSLSSFPYAGRLDTTGKAPVKTMPIEQFKTQLADMYHGETGVAHWDVVFSKVDIRNLEDNNKATR